MRSGRTPYKTQPAGYDSCPNCNARARVVVEREKPGCHFWHTYVVCRECRQRTWVGFISDHEKRKIDGHRELMERWAKAESPAERGQIMSLVKKIAREDEQWEKSL